MDTQTKVNSRPKIPDRILRNIRHIRILLGAFSEIREHKMLKRMD